MAQETPSPTTPAPMCPRCREAEQNYRRFVLVLGAVTEAAGGEIVVSKEVADRVQASDDLVVSFHQHADGRVIVRTARLLEAPPVNQVM